MKNGSTRIHKLKRKYGASVEDVLTYLQKSEQRLDEIEFASDRIETLKKQRGSVAKRSRPAGRNLREKRIQAAKEMETDICEELRQLDMPKIRFVCEFTRRSRAEPG